MFLLLETVVRIVSYCMFLYGLWVLIGEPFLKESIESVYKNWKRKRKIKRLDELKITKQENVERTKIISHIELLLNSISIKSKNFINAYNFIALTGIIFITTFLTLAFLIQDVLFAILVAVVLSVIPYLILRFKLTTFRINTQYAFMMEFHNVLQNYQSNNRDMYYTLMNVIKDTQDKKLKKIYMKLLSSLQKDRSENEFKQAVYMFSYAINSAFAKRFSKLLMKSQIDRADITQSLMDLNSDIKKRKQDIQKEKTQKLETVILGYLPVILFPIIFFAAYKTLSLVNFWSIFRQPLPLTVFMIAIVLSVFSVLSAYIFSKPRADV